jgi:hypothetical protein
VRFAQLAYYTRLRVCAMRFVQPTFSWPFAQPWHAEASRHPALEPPVLHIFPHHPRIHLHVCCRTSLSERRRSLHVLTRNVLRSWPKKRRWKGRGREHLKVRHGVSIAVVVSLPYVAVHRPKLSWEVGTGFKEILCQRAVAN